MSFEAVVYKVMIASPSDVVEERRIFREVIQEWNSINTDDEKVILMPIGWESDSIPEMGDRTQEILNRQLLDDSDLLVAVFGTRIGSPTGEFISGTVEEIEKQIESGKPVMMYFSKAPIDRNNLDINQYELLTEFEEKYKERGLIAKYNSPEEFKEKFRINLMKKLKTVIKKPSKPSNQVSDLGDDAKELLKETSNDADGYIVKKRKDYLKGLHIYTNKRQFVEPKNARVEARWEGALDELISKDLVKDVKRGEVFKITQEGYNIADSLSETEILGDDDIIISLLGWLGKNKSEKVGIPLKFSEIDGELNLPPGSAKRLIKVAGKEAGLVVKKEGNVSIIFEFKKREISIKAL